MPQDRPTMAELLAAVADFLREEAVPALDRSHPGLGFQMRVAANSLAMLEREARLGPAGAAKERELLTGLLGEEVDNPTNVLAARLRDGDDEAFEAKAWPVIAEITKMDLAIAKPGHDRWEGE